MFRFSRSADAFPPAYVGRISCPISSITANNCAYLLAAGTLPEAAAAAAVAGCGTIDPVEAANLAADGGGVPRDSGSATTDLGVSGLLCAIGVPGPELLDSITMSSSIPVADAIDAADAVVGNDALLLICMKCKRFTIIDRCDTNYSWNEHHCIQQGICNICTSENLIVNN
jgi:hypothetical protein